MSAARAAARNKPVVLVKAGRSAQGARAASSHTGALAGSDEVFDAAIARAGMLRVHTLHLFLAVEILARFRDNRSERLLRGWRDVPPAHRPSIHAALPAVAQLLADVPEIAELDIHPLVVDARGAVRWMRVCALAPADPAARCASRFGRTHRNGSRSSPGGPAAHVAPDSSGGRGPAPGVSREGGSAGHPAARLLQPPQRRAHRTGPPDADRLRPRDGLHRHPAGDGEETIGVVRGICDPDNDSAEFGILVRSDLKRRGLGRILMDKLIRYLRAHGTRRIGGQVLRENAGMLGLAARLGLTMRPRPHDPDLRWVELALQDAPPAA